jgi:hypothetical protein
MTKNSLFGLWKSRRDDGLLNQEAAVELLEALDLGDINARLDGQCDARKVLQAITDSLMSLPGAAEHRSEDLKRLAAAAYQGASTGVAGIDVNEALRHYGLTTHEEMKGGQHGGDIT